MDVIYRHQPASVADVHAALEDAPSYSAVRALINTLVDKGHLVHEREGRRYLYRATLPAEEARASALRRLIDTFFAGSARDAAVALVAETDLQEAELDALQVAIEQARREGR